MIDILPPVQFAERKPKWRPHLLPLWVDGLDSVLGERFAHMIEGQERVVEINRRERGRHSKVKTTFEIGE